MHIALITDINAGVGIESQLRERIKLDLDAYKGALPDRNAVAWHAYLAGLAEWGVISHPAHGRLISLLPRVKEPNPVEVIILGSE